MLVEVIRFLLRSVITTLLAAKVSIFTLVKSILFNDRFVEDVIVSCLFNSDVDIFSVKPSKYDNSVSVMLEAVKSPLTSVIMALLAVPENEGVQYYPFELVYWM